MALPGSYLGTNLGGRYRLGRIIGEGASAWVFAGQDLKLERDVAVKLLKPRPLDKRADGRRSSLAEGRTLAKLVHPHVVLVYDVGVTPEGIEYLVMELSGADNLEAELGRRGRLALAETLELLLPLVGALACAHDRGIVHRDIKPSNIAVVREGAMVRAKLLDAGAAGDLDSDESGQRAIGTPAYMAPEQVCGEPLTPAVDVWALGVVFFRCLAGRLPFEAGTTREMLLKIARQRAPWFADACPTLPGNVAIALDRALEPRLERRYPDMPSLARALLAACLRDRVTTGTGLQLSETPPLDLWLSAQDLNDAQRPTENLLTCDRPSGLRAASARLDGTPTQRLVNDTPGASHAPSGRVAPHPPSSSAEAFDAPDWTAPLDLDRRLALIPSQATVRGLFFNDILAQFPASRGFAPRDRYVAFKNYPFAEWCEFLTMAASRCFPTCTAREGVRRIGRRAFPALAETQAARVLFALAGADVYSAFRVSSKAFQLAQSIGSCKPIELDPCSAVLEIRDAWDYPDAYYVGVYEGFFQVVGKAVAVDVRVLGLADVDLQLRWEA